MYCNFNSWLHFLKSTYQHQTRGSVCSVVCPCPKMAYIERKKYVNPENNTVSWYHQNTRTQEENSATKGLIDKKRCYHGKKWILLQEFIAHLCTLLAILCRYAPSLPSYPLTFPFLSSNHWIYCRSLSPPFCLSPFLSLSLSLSVSLSLFLSVSLTFWFSLFLSVSLTFWFSLFVSLSFYLSLCLSLSVSLSMFQSLSLSL